jgi:hypothetical protein
MQTQLRRIVFPVTVQTLTLAWSPDSAAFLADDRDVSDRELAHIYDVKTLRRLDLRKRILAADGGAARFVPASTPPSIRISTGFDGWTRGMWKCSCTVIPTVFAGETGCGRATASICVTEWAGMA